MKNTLSEKSRQILKFALTFWISLIVAANSWALDLACGHVVPIQMKFLARHVNYKDLNRNLEVRTIDRFIKTLDQSKLYFTKAENETLKKSLSGIFDKTRKGDCEPIFAAHKFLHNKIVENVATATSYLQKDFKFDPTIKIVVDPLKRPYAKNANEIKDFQKKYVQLQIANYVATGVKAEEARTKVLKNYERSAKRMTEDTQADVLAVYLDSFATALDPHSTYWSKDAYEEFEISIRLSLEGIGATLSSKDGFTTIEQLIPGGSAAKSGLLKQKDMIVGVAQGEEGVFDDVIDQELRDVVKKIRGKKGTKVRLKLLRKSPAGPTNLEVTLVRDQISIEDDAASISYHEKESNGKKLKIGLLNLPSFYADNRTQDKSSASDMKKLLHEAHENKVDAIVLDLSNNGGGSLQDAVEIAGQFFGVGNVVKQSSRDSMGGDMPLDDKDPMVDFPGPLVVLTSRMSASASEIVAGTLKDYHRAVIVGADHTFGKGTVQTVEDLPQKLGALKTTIAMYFIPGGNSTQHIGVKSDIVFPSAMTLDEFGEKTQDYSLPPRKIPPFLSAEAFVPSGPGAWQLIDKTVVAKLNKTSQRRILKSADFKKVFADIQKSIKHKKDGELMLGDFLKDREDTTKEMTEDEGKTYEQSKVSRQERYLKRADVQESLNIAADLAVLEGAVGVAKKSNAKSNGTAKQ
jgi:carboxyl-terminal processing protease